MAGENVGGRGSTGPWTYSKDQQRHLAGGRQLGHQHKPGVWESLRCLGKVQLL